MIPCTYKVKVDIYYLRLQKTEVFMVFVVWPKILEEFQQFMTNEYQLITHLVRIKFLTLVPLKELSKDHCF